MTKTFNLTLAAGFLTAATLMTPVAFAQTSDQAETTAVQTAIDQDAGLRASGVHVQTIDGVVYVQGHVGSENAAERAGQIARSAANGAEVVNAVSGDQFQG